VLPLTVNCTVWKSLQNKEYNEYFKDNNFFWTATIHSLHYSWLLNLSKLYEESSYSQKKKIFSVPSLLMDQNNENKSDRVKKYLKKHKQTINNLKIRRDNQFAHNNKEHLLNPKNIETNKPIKYNSIENLLKDTPDILSNLHPYNDGYIFTGFSNNCKDDVVAFMKKIDFYLKQRKKYSKKFIKGEIDDNYFPILD
jgi:hypothetical protein